MSMCVIVGGGDFDGLDELPGERDLLIAADRGYEYLKEMGLKPDIIVGDFDSCKTKPEEEDIEGHQGGCTEHRIGEHIDDDMGYKPGTLQGWHQGFGVDLRLKEVNADEDG